MVLLIDSALLGALLAVNCKENGLYQGLLDNIDGTQSITLIKSFRDGHQVPGGSTQIALSSVHDLRVLAPPEGGRPVTVGQTSEAHRNVSLEKEPKNVPANVMAALGMKAEEKKNEGLNLMRYNADPPKSTKKVKPTPKKFSQSYTNGVHTHQPTTVMKRMNVNSLLVQHPSSPTSSGCVTGTEDSPNNDHKYDQFQYEEFGQFKKFGRQIPQPCVLQNRKTPRDRYVGPTGIPATDCANGYGLKANQNRHVDLQHVDHAELTNDFDFEANLLLFRREDLDDMEYELKEKPNESDNYAHDENIIADPARVISWVNRQPDTSFSPLGSLTAKKGHSIPLLSKSDKQRLLKAAEEYLGHNVLPVVLADRILLFLLQIAERFKLRMRKVVLLVTERSDSHLIQTLVRHLRNRRNLPYLYGLGTSVDKVDGAFVVESVKEIPFDAEVVISLDGAHHQPSLQPWMLRAANGPRAAHVIAVEDFSSSYTFGHTLLAGLPSDEQSSSIAELNSKEGVVALADIGVPFHWMNSSDHTNNLADAFLHGFLVNL
ncbi:hypothetical protein L596_007361 [Steinernema carpocapsae]|uniref:DFDF domain-containing protein n=1 Tax=Steinernema carpocapsae TaxID=34508 RepID=A0A4U5P9R3_STECR|nr:hypothetical protein L596_007361 [Steinernema carpocapsae]